MEENEIIKKIQAGDKNEYRHLVSQYKNLVYSIIRKQVRDHELSEDLAQEVFVKAYLNIKSFRFESKFSTWLTRIAINHANSYFSSKVYKQKIKNNEFEPFEHSSSANQEEEYLKAENFKHLLECVAKLKESFRQVVVLNAFEGKAYQEVAEIVGVPLGTVRSRLNRARLMLLTCMDNKA